MKISEVIEQLKSKSQSEPVRDERPKDFQWEKVKDHVDTWTADFAKVLEDNASRVYSHKSGKSTRMSLKMGTLNGHDIELIVYEGDTTRAFYAVYNNQLRTVYKRDLI